MRAFVALDVSPEIQDKLGSLIRTLSAHTLKVKWTEPKQIHLTLKFFDSLLPAQQEPVSKVLNEIARHTPSLRLEVRGVGFFASGDRIRVLWSGVEEATGRLSLLHKAIEDKLAGMGFEKEGRPFKAHLTLGRLREASREPQLIQALKDHMAFNAGVVAADRLALYSSTLTPAGPIYGVLAQWRLEGGR